MKNLKLNYRHFKILKTLILKEDYISKNDLGIQLGLSARIIGYNLPYLQAWLDFYNIEIVSSPGKGLLLVASQKEREFLYSSLQGQEIERLFSSEDRFCLILVELFIQKDYITSHYLTEILSVSRTTIFRDLQRVKKWLQTHEIELDKRQKKGIKIIGSEIRIRHALISLFFEIENYVPILIKLSLQGQRISKKKMSFLQMKVFETFHTEPIIDAWRFISNIQTQLEFQFADMDCLILAIYWCYMLIRIKLGYSSNMSKDHICLIKNQDLFAIIKNTCDLYHKETGHEIDDSEKAFLTLEVYSSIRAYDVIDKQKFNLLKNNQYIGIAKNIINKVSENIGVRLYDYQVSVQLASHIAKTHFCMKCGLPIKNPFTLQIKYENKLLWRITKDVLNELNIYDGLTIPQEEISFITVYMVLAHDIALKKLHTNKVKVLVVCLSGGVTARVLVNRMQNHFPDIEIIGVVKHKELGSYTKNDVDLIVSTIFTTHRTIPVVCVSPFLNKEDIDSINKFIL